MSFESAVRRLCGLFLVVTLIGCDTGDQQTTGADIDQSDPARFELLDGSFIDFNVEDQIVFVNYWAEWCLPCLEEMPILKAFNERYQGSARVYGYNFDNPDSNALNASIRKLNVEIPILLDDPKSYFDYDSPRGLPTTILIHKGSVRKTMLGPQTIATLQEAMVKVLDTQS